MANHRQLDRKLLFILILVVFLDICNFFMPVPIYTPLFLHGHFLHGISPSTAVILLGVLVSCFGFAQLFGGPIFGELSDQYGRKNILLVALFSGMVGTLLAAISLSTGAVWLIYLSRFIIGFSSGTVGISYAVAADLSDPEDLAKNIGYISLGPCFASALGPMVGGHLATNPYLAVFGVATPFYFLGAVFFIVTLLIAAYMPKDPASQVKVTVHPFTAVTNIIKVMKRSALLRNMIFMAIFFQLGTEGFFLAVPIIAVKEYHMTAAAIANHFLLFALGASLSTWLNPHISKYMSSYKIYLICITVLVIGFFMAYSTMPVFFWLAFFCFGIGGMMCWVHTNNIFSAQVSQSEQGLIMGVSQAMWSLGGLLSSLIVGLMAAVHYKATGILLISTEVLSFIMMCFVMRACKRQKS